MVLLRCRLVSSRRLLEAWVGVVLRRGRGFFDALRLEHDTDNIKVTMICPGFVNTNVARNALTGDGSSLDLQDRATEKGLDVSVFARRMLKAIKKEKFEAYIGKGETKGIYLKRFFPKLLHKVVLKSKVR